MFELQLHHCLIRSIVHPGAMKHEFKSVLVFVVCMSGDQDSMNYCYSLKYEISKQQCSSEHSFLSPCRSEHSRRFYQPATSLKVSVLLHRS
jgi:hypothetical protein